MTNKLYCGLDFHKNVSELCLMDESGNIIETARLDNKKLLLFLANKPPYHIGIEASGAVFDICQKLESIGHRVTIINPVQFRGIGITGKKNDKNDAKALATALRLGFVPEVYKKTLYARRIRSLLASRDLLVRTRTQITNHIRGILREYGLPIPMGATEFWKNVRQQVSKLDCEIMRQSLSRLVDESNRLKTEEQCVESLLIEMSREDQRIIRLQTVPGIGPMTAMTIVAAVDDITRFKDAKSFASYIGITPRENSSGHKVRYGSITRCGPEMVRRYLIHGARTVFRYRNKQQNILTGWLNRLEQRSTANKAIVALAHKNARICFALLRDGTSYENLEKVA